MTMVWDKVTITMISVVCFGILYAVVVSVIDYYNLPLFRLKRYRIMEEFHPFRHFDGKISGYYIYYIQETYFIFWNNIPDNRIPFRKDGEGSYEYDQRQDNYFRKYEHALIIKNKIREELESKYEIIKAKKKNRVMKD